MTASVKDFQIISKTQDEFIPILPTQDELKSCRTGIAVQINHSKNEAERERLKLILWDVDFLIGML